MKIHISPQCRDYLVKLGGYVIEERGLVYMKGKGEVLTYWLISHTRGQLHRRESIPEDFLQVPTFIYSGNDTKKRSPIACVLPRKGSLVTFKGNKTDGSNINLSNSRLPAFLRLKTHDSECSIITNSPKPNKKLLLPIRQNRLLLRDQMTEDINLTNDSQIHSIFPKTSTNFVIKSSDRLNTLNEIDFSTKDINQKDIKHESSTPLLGDDNQHNGTNCCSNDQNFLIDFGINEEKPCRVPLLSSQAKNNNSVVPKKWNSCTELEFDKSVTKKSNQEKSHKSNNNSINARTDGQKIESTVKDWSKISLIQSNHVINEPIIREKTVEQTNCVKRRPSNCDFLIKTLNDCELKVESSV